MKTRKIVKTRINNEVIIDNISELTKDGYFKIQWHFQEF